MVGGWGIEVEGAQDMFDIGVVDFGGCIVVVGDFGWYYDMLDVLWLVVVYVVYQTLLARLFFSEEAA